MFLQPHSFCLPVPMMTNTAPLFLTVNSSKLARDKHILRSQILRDNSTRKRGNICIRHHVCNAIPDEQLDRGRHISIFSASVETTSLDDGLKIAERAPNSTLSDCFDVSKRKVMKMFDRVDLSISSYDTAWVAMVPSPSSPETPCFPECLKWVLGNQHDDGSWGLLHHGHPFSVKDALSSTLACVLALRRWGVGEEEISKGLRFIESNFALASDEKQHNPIGFDIIFPGMIEYAKDVNLPLDLDSIVLDRMLRWRDLEIKRLQNDSKGSSEKSYLAYVSEGVGKFQDWEMVMKYQKEDGSLFNSPSTTAAALIHLKDPPGCLDYLRSVVKRFGNSVPAVYPLDIYTRVCMVDTLVKLGIDRHFKKEIKMVLDMTYRSWLQKDEEIFSNVTTCAITFRILLLNRYKVSPDPLVQLLKDGYTDTFSGNMDHMCAALEVYKALELITNIDEAAAMEKAYSWCRKTLQNKSFLSSHTEKFRLEVNDALRFPYSENLECITNRRYIEQHYDKDATRLQKTSYMCPNTSNDVFLKLAVEDFNACQQLYRDELECISRWFVENRLDQLKYIARANLSNIYCTAAATMFSPELKDSRLAWTKNSLLIIIDDDLFDSGGSQEETLNLVELVSKWDGVNLDADCCSDQVRILFSAIRGTVCDIGDRASKWQGRDVTNHIRESWLDVLKSFLKEAEWISNNAVPTMDEYIANGHVSAAVGPCVVSASYLHGQKLPEKIFTSDEFHSILKLTSLQSRLLNDVQSNERERKEGKVLNAVSLCMIHSDISKEKAVEEIRNTVKCYQKELFELVFANQETDSIVPSACKNLLWSFCKVVHLFYRTCDGLETNLFADLENQMLNDPIELDQL